MTNDITLEKDGHVALVTLNRPHRGNAITLAMLHRIDEVFGEVDDDDGIRAAVLTGAGPSVFCAGADLAELIPMITADSLSVAVPDRTKRMLSDVATPIVAAINGACLAGGLEILLGTDIRIAAEHAIFGAPEVRHGLFAAGGSHVRLTRQIPFAVAQELLLTGRTLSAERAREVGLINAVVPADRLLAEAMVWAESICAAGPLAVRAAKEAAIASQMLEEAFRIESLIADRVFASKDAREGPAAFLDKRAPRFTGQ